MPYVSVKRTYALQTVHTCVISRLEV